jgi:hypothetical protein
MLILEYSSGVVLKKQEGDPLKDSILLEGGINIMGFLEQFIFLNQPAFFLLQTLSDFWGDVLVLQLILNLA